VFVALAVFASCTKNGMCLASLGVPGVANVWYSRPQAAGSFIVIIIVTPWFLAVLAPMAVIYAYMQQASFQNGTFCLFDFWKQNLGHNLLSHLICPSYLSLSLFEDSWRCRKASMALLKVLRSAFSVCESVVRSLVLPSADLPADCS
jgi:hypothetical protein